MTAGWPQWTVPDDAYDRALSSAPHHIAEDRPGWDDDLTTALNAAIPIIRAATLRQAADRYVSEIGKAVETATAGLGDGITVGQGWDAATRTQHAAAVAATLRRWADEVQP